MKNSEIHRGLPQSEIRDFLSLAMVKAYEEEVNNRKNEIPYTHKPKNQYQWVIKDTEAHIEHLQRSLAILKTKEAIVQLINNSGWQEFDVSDETEKDLPYRLKMNFVGTEEEYNELLKKIEYNIK